MSITSITLHVHLDASWCIRGPRIQASFLAQGAIGPEHPRSPQYCFDNSPRHPSPWTRIQRDRWELHWCFRGRMGQGHESRFAINFLPSKMTFCAGEIQVFCHMPPNLKLPVRCKSSPSKDFGLLIWAWSWSTSWLAPNLLYLLPFFPLNLLMILMVVLCCSILLSIPSSTAWNRIHMDSHRSMVKSCQINIFEWRGLHVEAPRIRHPRQQLLHIHLSCSTSLLDANV